MEWKKDPEEEVGIILEDLPDEEQVKWAAIQSVFLEERTSGENTKRLEEYKEEIKELYGRVIRERERQREMIQEEMRSQKRLGKMTAKEVQAIKVTMDSFITNDLSSHLAQAIQHHFGAFPIAQNIAQYLQENPISSIPPPHEQDAWKAAIEGVVLQHIRAIPAPPRAEDIVAQVTQNLQSELSSLKTEILQSIPKAISTEEIRRQINTAVSCLSGPSSQGISEDKCNRMIRTALAARIVPSSQGLTEEQVQERIRTALNARPAQTGITEAQVEGRIKAALEAANLGTRPAHTGLTEEQVNERIEKALAAQQRQWVQDRTERLIVVQTTQQRQATEPYLFSGKDQDIKDWLLKCQDFFGRNPETWVSDRERIIYAIGRLANNSKAQDFGTHYRRAMDGLEGIIRVDTHKYWANFEKAIKDRFLSSEETSQAIIKIDQLTYQKDIHDFVAKFKTYNALAGYTGELLRTKIKGKIPTPIRHRMVAGDPVDTDELWLEKLKRVGVDEERFENETKALRDVNTKPKDKGKGKDTSKGESSKTNKNPEKRKETFPKPADWKNLTEKEKEEREKRLGNMSQALQKERRDSKVCIRCGKKGHGQYTCTAPKPVISSTSRKRKTPENSENEEEEENPRKKKSGEERITALERMIASMKKNGPKKRGRVFEIEDDEDMEDA